METCSVNVNVLGEQGIYKYLFLPNTGTIKTEMLSGKRTLPGILPSLCMAGRIMWVIIRSQKKRRSLVTYLRLSCEARIAQPFPSIVLNLLMMKILLSKPNMTIIITRSPLKQTPGMRNGK